MIVTIDKVDGIKNMATKAEDAIKAIQKAEGNVTDAARSLGLSRQQLYNIMKSKPTVKEALDEARETFKDEAEGMMRQKIRDGDTTMLIFYAKTQMKDRGYVERQEVTGAEGEVISVKVIKGVSLDDL